MFDLLNVKTTIDKKRIIIKAFKSHLKTTKNKLKRKININMQLNGYNTFFKAA